MDSETSLADVGEACQYCEADEGYKVLGALVAYEIKDEASEEDTTEEAEVESEIEVVAD